MKTLAVIGFALAALCLASCDNAANSGSQGDVGQPGSATVISDKGTPITVNIIGKWRDNADGDIYTFTASSTASSWTSSNTGVTQNITFGSDASGSYFKPGTGSNVYYSVSGKQLRVWMIPQNPSFDFTATFIGR